MVLSGFFSSSETSLFSLSNVQLEQMRKDQHPRIGLIQQLLSQPRRLIITILIGNELVNLTASVISASIVIRVLGAQNKWTNLIIMVPLLLLVGEITPKVLAIRHNVAFSSFESKPIEWFARLIKPMRLIVRNVADWFITLVIGKERSRGNIITEDMVRILAREALGEGALDHLEAQFIEQIFDFGNKTLEDVMTPRSDIFFLAIDRPLHEIIAEVCKSRHTKIPIYQENRDNVCGILHSRDLLGIDVDKLSGDPLRLQGLLRKPYFVPESKLAADLFRTFRERKLSIALTVDEYGGVTGLVTMEDLLECIFGEIHSPSDEVHQVSITDLGEGRYVVEGSMPVAEFNQEMGSELSDEWGETIGGLLLHHYGELPPQGDKIEIDGFRFIVTEVEENRIKTVEFEKIQEIIQSSAEQSEDPEDKIQNADPER
ncbi:MAG: hemolysin family protein [Desulfobacterales bacterium]